MSGLSNAGLPGDPARSSALPNSISGLSHPVSTARSEIDTAIPDVPVRWRELFGVFAIVAVSDITLYRSYGYAGYAVFFAVAPLLFWLSSPERRSGRGTAIVATLLFALSAKLLWCGSGLLVACGFTLILAFAMTIISLTPHVIEAIAFAIQAIPSGFSGIRAYWHRIDGYAWHKPRSGWGTLIAPALAFMIFSWIFVLANPDVLHELGEAISQLVKRIDLWLRQWSPDFMEVWFWVAVWWIAVGLLRPRISRVFYEVTAAEEAQTTELGPPPPNLYPMFRNTMLTVTILFAVYLPFEFGSLWFREFPEGFYYSGYAHEGAAWLTTALALATLILSMVFRGNIANDPRIGVLRRLAWLWSIENLLLAAAIYHRLFIYVGFNGMTRMRIVGLYGISAVLVGFFVVIWKIVYQRNFVWLLRRQLLTLAIALYLLAMTPLDSIVVSYNVRRILAGDPAPAVQISVHPINSEGIPMLTPLLDCENEIVREGVRALLADYYHSANEIADRRTQHGWTAVQLADRWALHELRIPGTFKSLNLGEAPSIRQERLKRFHDYVYQWY